MPLLLDMPTLLDEERAQVVGFFLVGGQGVRLLFNRVLEWYVERTGQSWTAQRHGFTLLAFELLFYLVGLSYLFLGRPPLPGSGLVRVPFRSVSLLDIKVQMLHLYNRLERSQQNQAHSARATYQAWIDYSVGLFALDDTARSQVEASLYVAAPYLAALRPTHSAILSLRPSRPPPPSPLPPALRPVQPGGPFSVIEATQRTRLRQEVLDALLSLSSKATIGEPGRIRLEKAIMWPMFGALSLLFFFRDCENIASGQRPSTFFFSMILPLYLSQKKRALSIPSTDTPYYPPLSSSPPPLPTFLDRLSPALDLLQLDHPTFTSKDRREAFYGAVQAAADLEAEERAAAFYERGGETLLLEVVLARKEEKEARRKKRD